MSVAFIVWALMGAAPGDNPEELPPMDLYVSQAVCEENAALVRGPNLIVYCRPMPVRK
jgi:hypothetical protein